MTNELIFIIIALLDFLCILVVGRFGRSWLVAMVIFNILLISTFGAKLVSIFGFTTNTGNIFYAAVFFATQLLVEQHGKKEGYQSILVGVVAIIFFILMSQLIILTSGIPETQSVNKAIETLFQAAPRIAFASLLAYLFSQTINIWIFDYLKSKTADKHVYLRVNLSNLAGQFVDSLIFFAVAFYGIVPLGVLIQTMTAGFLLKVIIGALSTPFFYLNLSFHNASSPKNA